jgi:tetrahydromethanopterin S-methyltransferase subunit F
VCAQLTTALDSIREIVAHVNDIKRRSQAISRVAEINQKIIGCARVVM